MAVGEPSKKKKAAVEAGQQPFAPGPLSPIRPHRGGCAWLFTRGRASPES